MFSVLFYIVPAVLTRFLFHQKPMGKGGAIAFSAVLFVVLVPFTILMHKMAGHLDLGSGVPWVIGASIWSYFILRTEMGIGGEKSVRPEASQGDTQKRKQVSSPSAEPKSSSATAPAKENKREKPRAQTRPAAKKEPEPAAGGPVKKETPKKSAPKPDLREPAKTEKPDMSNPHDDEQFYEQVAAELKEDNIRQGLWLKAETKAQGDADKTRLLYIEWRVEQLVDEVRQQIEKEEEKKVAEEARLLREKEKKVAEEMEKREALRQKAEAEQRLKEEVEEVLNTAVFTIEEAEALFAPLRPHGYSVERGFHRGESVWQVRSPRERPKERHVYPDKLVRYVRDQIATHGYEIKSVPCDSCGSPMVEIAKAVWKCRKCIYHRNPCEKCGSQMVEIAKAVWKCEEC
jgi:ribosomal protein L37AE/L43A